MVFCQATIWLLVYYTSHVPTWTIVGHHVKVLECLECVVKLRDKPVIDLSLDLFFSDDEAREPIVSTLLHTFHRVELSSALPLCI